MVHHLPEGRHIRWGPGVKAIGPLIFLILLGALVALALGIAAVRVLRTFVGICLSYGEGCERDDLSWRDYRPIQRLLDPADFDYLRRRGVPAARIQKLKTERREIYRLCLRSLARDFNCVCRSLNLVLIQSYTDRPDLAAQLGQQRIAFYRNMLRLELRLSLYGWCVNRMPAIDLLGPLETLQAQLMELAPASASA